MVRPRVAETEHGIIGESVVEAYDTFMRRLRGLGLLQTASILKSGIDSRCVLEIGPGPDYEGLEWLKRTKGTTLKGLDISEDMVALAEKNALDYGLAGRAEYFLGDARWMPFEDAYFDAVFSTNSLHEFAHPQEVLSEIHRVLKPGGKYFISDLRRDMNPLVKWFIWLCMPRELKDMQAGFISSVNAAYTQAEASEMLAKSGLQGWRVEQKLIYIVISGRKTT